MNIKLVFVHFIGRLFIWSALRWLYIDIFAIMDFFSTLDTKSELVKPQKRAVTCIEATQSIKLESSRVGRASVAVREGGVGVIATLVVVVFHVKRLKLREINTKRAAAVVDVLTVERLKTFET